MNDPRMWVVIPLVMYSGWSSYKWNVMQEKHNIPLMAWFLQTMLGVVIIQSLAATVVILWISIYANDFNKEVMELMPYMLVLAIIAFVYALIVDIVTRYRHWVRERPFDWGDDDE